MTRLITIILMITLLIPSSVYAQKKFSYLKEDDIAPFEGVLLDPVLYFELELEIERLKKEAEIKEDYYLKRSELDCELSKIDPKTSWWEDNQMTIGVVLGITGTVLTFIIVDSISDSTLRD